VFIGLMAVAYGYFALTHHQRATAVDQGQIAAHVV
jgi:hypothetical protein